MESATAADQPAQAGSSPLAALFLDQEAALLRFARKLVNDETTAQDCVQEAFHRLQPRFAEVTEPRPWLFRTVHNLAMDHHRRHRKLVPFAQPEGEGGAAPALDEARPHDGLEARERSGLVRVCLERLDTRSRTLIKQKYGEGLSYQDIAQRHGLRPGHVGYLLHHALKALEAELRKDGIDHA